MYTVYILQSTKDKKTYVGYSGDFKRRFKEHNSGWVRATKHRRPLVILFTEEFENESDAKKRELYWKNGGGRRRLKKYFAKNKSEA
jgi:putative endonuclease